ncbi:NRT1/ PTR family 2.13-like protein [Tanacetum coccineum]|uniref:NRT1/ PTR family 2.13-like protein n=1 Tax=Tanacetum coccineum TaxID=301880 RepID=A0ABQ5CYC0_9ASTR
MVIMTLMVAIPKLHPPSCTGQQAILNQCQGPTNRQFGILVLPLGFLSIGTGGIRPCSLPFGVDQFDPTTDEALVASYKKRKLDGGKVMIKDNLYDPLVKGTYAIQTMPLRPVWVIVFPLSILTTFLNKAAIILDGDLNPDGTRVSSWNLSSIQQIEEEKCIIKVFPIVASGSMSIISMITIGIWLPLYDRVIVPSLRKITKIDTGITLLQRIGIVMWLAPQLILMGFAEAFNILGQLEFYYKEFPDNMKSVANAMFFVTAGGANYVSSALISTVHNVTGKHGHPDWLAKNINEARVDNFYYTIAGLGVLNLAYYLLVACRYQYKKNIQVIDEESQSDVELNGSIKK